MAIYCSNCGKQLSDEAKFCSACGTVVAQAQPQNTPPNVQMVTPHIGLGPDGKYRWIYEMSLFKNPSIFLTVWKIFFFIIIGIFFFMLFIQAIEGYLDGEAFLGILKLFGIVLGVMNVIIVISFLIYAAVMGGKYIVMFEMDENGINHKQLPKQAQKAQGIAIAAFLIGAAANNRAAMTGGIAASNTEMYTSFGKTKKLRFYPKRDLIKIRQTLSHNQIYAKPEDFAFVQNYIFARVPDSARPKM